jgi:hypothetical protein
MCRTERCSSNRTIKELKWLPHCQISQAAETSNRTIKELKYRFVYGPVGEVDSSNRTIKELKLATRLFYDSNKGNFQSHHKGIEIHQRLQIQQAMHPSNRTIKELKLSIAKAWAFRSSIFQSHHKGIEIIYHDGSEAVRKRLPIAP